MDPYKWNRYRHREYTNKIVKAIQVHHMNSYKISRDAGAHVMTAPDGSFSGLVMYDDGTWFMVRPFDFLLYDYDSEMWDAMADRWFTINHTPLSERSNALTTSTESGEPSFSSDFRG